MHPELPELRGELLRRAERDQHVRHSLGHPPSAQQWARVKAIDADNTSRLERVVADHGWPGSRLVDADGAHCAWLLAQHTPLDFQQRHLPLLRQAVGEGQAREVELAYLDDRVRIREQRPQRHGTQWVIDDTEHRLLPLDAPDGVNERRNALGLPLLDEVNITRALPYGSASDR